MQVPFLFELLYPRQLLGVGLIIDVNLLGVIAGAPKHLLDLCLLAEICLCRRLPLLLQLHLLVHHLPLPVLLGEALPECGRLLHHLHFVVEFSDSLIDFADLLSFELVRVEGRQDFLSHPIGLVS